MKIAIIGIGNMGGSIARGLMDVEEYDILVSDPDERKIQELLSESERIKAYDDNGKAAAEADVVILAVKPYLIDKVFEDIAEHCDCNDKIIIGLADLDLSKFHSNINISNSAHPDLFIAIPNTAISVKKGITFISDYSGNKESSAVVKSIFDKMGETVFVDTKLRKAGTALCSCGIAYAFKYIQACVQAGVQLGFRPDEAKKYAVLTVAGAMELLNNDDADPVKEIFRVTTPGGMTIKGINQLDKEGFPAAIISSIMRPIE